MPAFVGLHRQEHRRQGVVAVAGGFRGHRDEQRVGERGFRNDRQVHVGRGDRITGYETFGELPSDGGGVAAAEGGFRDVESGRVDVILHIPLLQVHLNRGVAEFIDHLHGEAGAQFLTRGEPADHGHGTGGGDFREGNDGEEQLHPFDPARLHVAEHVATQRGIQRAVNAVVLFLLHREVGAQHLLHRIARGLLDLVVGREGHRFLDIARRPAEVRDAAGGFADTDSALCNDFVEGQTIRH